MKISKTEVAQTLGELIKLGLVEAVIEEGQPTRYRLTGVPVDGEQETSPRRIPVARVNAVEALSAVEIRA